MYEEQNEFQRWYNKQQRLDIEKWKNDHPCRINPDTVDLNDYCGEVSPEYYKEIEDRRMFIENQLGSTLEDIRAFRISKRLMEAKQLYDILKKDGRVSFDELQLTKKALDEHGIKQEYKNIIVKDIDGSDFEVQL